MGKITLKNGAANALELTSTALQIASEITTFVAGIGFFIEPPLKKVYRELLGKNMRYSVTANGELCVDGLQKIRPLINSSYLMTFNTSLFDFNDKLCLKESAQPLLSSNIVFNLPFPQGLFSASLFLCTIGCSGLLFAFLLNKCGTSLHDTTTEMPPSELLVFQANRREKPLAITSILLILGSRIAAIYATTTISMAVTLRNAPSILVNFSIPSSQQFKLDSSTLRFVPELAINNFFNTISLTMKFMTHIDFAELRKAAEKGSQKIDSYDYYVGLGMAVVALILGHLALKIQQQSAQYTDILLRHKHAGELQNQLQKPGRALSASNPNRMFPVINNSVQNYDIEGEITIAENRQNFPTTI